MRVLPQLDYHIGYLDRQIAAAKREWMKFAGKFNANLRVLTDKIVERQARHRSSATSQHQRENPLCTELIAFVAHSQLSEELYQFIVSELTNTNILASLAEGCQVQLTIIQDDVTANMLPVVSHLAFTLHDLRSRISAKTSVGAPMLGFDSEVLQSLIDAAHAFKLHLEAFVTDLVKAKRELRNLFVFLNNQALKIHAKKQDLKQQQDHSEPPEREEISNSRSDIAKLIANLQVLVQTLQEGDKHLTLAHIAKCFGEDAGCKWNKMEEAAGLFSESKPFESVPLKSFTAAFTRSVRKLF